MLFWEQGGDQGGRVKGIDRYGGQEGLSGYKVREEGRACCVLCILMYGSL